MEKIRLSDSSTAFLDPASEMGTALRGDGSGDPGVPGSKLALTTVVQRLKMPQEMNPGNGPLDVLSDSRIK